MRQSFPPPPLNSTEVVGPNSRCLDFQAGECSAVATGFEIVEVAGDGSAAFWFDDAIALTAIESRNLRP